MATSPLQKAPIALLQSLALQTLGRAPTGFGDTVVPVVDAREHYRRDLQRFASGQSTGTNPGNVVLTVPSGQIWRPRYLHAALDVDVADLASWSAVRLWYLVAGVAGVVLASVAASFDEDTSQYLNRIATFSWDVDQLLLPGDALMASVSLTGAFTMSATLSAALVYDELPG